MTFEDAIAKFFSQSENHDGKNTHKTQSLIGYDFDHKGAIKFSDDDLKAID